jgi:hypothetical protein
VVKGEANVAKKAMREESFLIRNGDAIGSWGDIYFLAETIWLDFRVAPALSVKVGGVF